MTTHLARIEQTLKEIAAHQAANTRAALRADLRALLTKAYGTTGIRLKDDEAAAFDAMLARLEPMHADYLYELSISRLADMATAPPPRLTALDSRGCATQGPSSEWDTTPLHARLPDGQNGVQS